METFQQTFGFVAAISIGVVIITAIVYIVRWLERLWRKDDFRVFEDAALPKGRVTIHIRTGAPIEGVTLAGFTRSSCGSGAVPYELSRMLAAKREDGRLLLLPASIVRMIEEL